jgi:Anti-sigma-28 factor, FlgM
VCGLKKSKFTAPLVVGREDAVSNGAFIDELLRLLVGDSADGVRWDKVATIKSALTDGTYSVSVEDLAEKIISARRAIT